MGEIEKRECPTCGQLKDYRQFIDKKSRKKYSCSSCRVLSMLQDQPSNIERKKCVTCGIAIPLHRFYDEEGIKHNECLACRILGPCEVTSKWDKINDERAERYIAELEKIVRNKKKEI